MRTNLPPVFLAVAALTACAQVNAASLQWDIDSTQSSFTMSYPGQALEGATIQIRNQSGPTTAWTVGNVAAIDGTLATDFVDGVSIQFLTGQHDVHNLNSGNYRPNPASYSLPLNPDGTASGGGFIGTGTAPAAYGGRFRAAVDGFGIFDVAMFSLYGTEFDLGSSVLPLAGSNFAANTTTVGLESGLMAVDTTSVVLIVFGDGIYQVGDSSGTNASATGSVTSPNPIGQPNLRRLSLPVSFPAQMDVNGTQIQVHFTGNVVAFATVPEPSSVALAGMGLMALGWMGVKRHRRKSRA